MKPTIFAITVLTFIAALSTMSGPLIVGGPDFQTINPMIKTFANMTGSRDIAALLGHHSGSCNNRFFWQSCSILRKRGISFPFPRPKRRMEKQKIENPVLNVTGSYRSICDAGHLYAPDLSTYWYFPLPMDLTIKTGQIRKDSFTMENYAKLFRSPAAYQAISRERGVFPSGGTGCCGNLYCGCSYCDKGKA